LDVTCFIRFNMLDVVCFIRLNMLNVASLIWINRGFDGFSAEQINKSSIYIEDGEFISQLSD